MLGLNNLERPITFLESMALSSCSGLIASIITNPLDVVKTRMQVQRAEASTGSKGHTPRYGYKNAFHGIYKLFKEEGITGSFRGSSARITYMCL